MVPRCTLQEQYQSNHKSKDCIRANPVFVKHIARAQSKSMYQIVYPRIMKDVMMYMMVRYSKMALMKRCYLMIPIIGVSHIPVAKCNQVVVCNLSKDVKSV